MPHTLTDVNPADRTALCAECGPTHIRGKNDGRRPEYVGWRCSPGSPKKSAAVNARRRMRFELFDEQDGKCGICGTAFESANAGRVDHDHETGKVRGLLCIGCNIGLGHLGDRLEGLQAASDYLRRAELR